MDPLLYVNSNLTSSFWLSPVTPIEVENITRDLKDTKTNLNMIDISSFKENSNLIAVTISDLINVCFLSGIFRMSLKRPLFGLYSKGGINFPFKIIVLFLNCQH